MIIEWILFLIVLIVFSIDCVIFYKSISVGMFSFAMLPLVGIICCGLAIALSPVLHLLKQGSNMSYLVVLAIGVVIGFVGCFYLVCNGYIKVRKG